MMTDSSPDDAMPIVGLKTSNNNSDNDDGKKTASAIQHDIKEKLTEADRLIAFTDAVVAIAMTLLILPLQEASAAFNEYTSVSAFFKEDDHMIQFYSFIVSFYVIWKLWGLHEFLCRRIAFFSQWLRGLNYLWMVGVVLLPVFTNFLFSGDNSGVAIYMGNLLCLRVITLLMGMIIRSDKHTWKEDKHGSGSGSGLVTAFFVTTIVDTLLLAISIPLALLIDTAFFLLILLSPPIIHFLELKYPDIGHYDSLFAAYWHILLNLWHLPRHAFAKGMASMKTSTDR